VLAYKANPSYQDLLSMLSTKSTQYDSTAVHALHCQLHAHAIQR
jgi:hypothetical protein